MCHAIEIYLKFSNYPLQSLLELGGTQPQTMSESTLDEPNKMWKSFNVNVVNVPLNLNSSELFKVMWRGME